MSDLERGRNPELPFDGKIIYFSAALSGGRHKDPRLLLDVADYMEKNGAVILNKHVPIRDGNERNSMFIRLSGIDRLWPQDDWINGDASPLIREASLEWVDRATHLVAFVDTPSFGVGIEIQEALRKVKMGMNLTPVLCLFPARKWEKKKSNMVKGIGPKDSPAAYVESYKNKEHAEQIIYDFLQKKY